MHSRDLRVWGPTAPDPAHLDGVVVQAAVGDPRLEGLAVAPCGAKEGKSAAIVSFRE